jgi:hypothetical protein
VLDKVEGPTAEELLAEEIKKHQVGSEVVDIVRMGDEMIDGKTGAKK